MALRRVTRSVTGIALAAGVISCIAQPPIFTVDGGHRGLIFDRFYGIKEKVYSEGLHLRIPLIQNKIIIFDVRTKPFVFNTQTGSKDLQTVNLSLRVLSKPDVTRLYSIYTKIGVDYEEKVLPSIANEVLKSVVAMYDAGELITQREIVSRKVRDNLMQRAKDYGIILDDISITHLTFSKEYTSAVEAKQVAQQDAERSKFVVMKAEQERKAAVIKAEGEAFAAKLINDAIMLAGPGLIELRRIEAAKEIAETLGKSKNIVYLPSSGNLLFNLSPNTSQP